MPIVPMTIRGQTPPPGGVLSSASKLRAGSRALNLSRPGHAGYCDPACPHITGACYDMQLLKGYKGRAIGVHRDRMQAIGPVAAMDAARAQIQAEHLSQPIPWFRFSAGGAMPQRITPAIGRSLRALLETLDALEIPVHLPVETQAKAARYRRAVRGLATVRESAIDAGRFLRARVPVSVVAGTRSQHWTARIDAARQLAQRKRDRSGRRCIVCPAVVRGWTARHRDRLTGLELAAATARTHCGRGGCTACSDPNTDIIFPHH